MHSRGLDIFIQRLRAWSVVTDKVIASDAGCDDAITEQMLINQITEVRKHGHLELSNGDPVGVCCLHKRLSRSSQTEIIAIERLIAANYGSALQPGIALHISQ